MFDQPRSRLNRVLRVIPIVAGPFLALAVWAQMPPIGIVDFYGLGSLSERQARDALGIKEGDPPPASTLEARRRLERLPGVAEASITTLCCDQGKAIVYAGFRHQGTPPLRFDPAPAGKVRLPQDVLKAAGEFEHALEEGITHGDNGEDVREGHSLSHYPPARAVQERFIGFAARDLSLLRNVLHHSSDAEHRAVAADVIAYTNDKQAVVPDLIRAASDPAEGVRNNATRALFVMAASNLYAPKRPLRIDGRPFIRMLNSLEWKDRNKASALLQMITLRRDPLLLEVLRKDALPALIEMARWKSAGHAEAPFRLLGRVAGFSEGAIQQAWDRRDVDILIRATRKH